MFFDIRGKTNAQVYDRAFRELLMRPDPNRPGAFLGNSQREEFLPILASIVNRVGQAKHARVLDVGAGSGEVVDFALSTLSSATVSVEEPNPILLDRYRERIANAPTLSLGGCYPGPLQDFYRTPEGSRWFSELPPQDLILAIHMIYHLTPFATESVIDPEKDLRDMLLALYAKLAPGGTLLVVYADQTRSMGGHIGYRYYRERSERYADNLRSIWESRNRLLRDGGVAAALQSVSPDYECRIVCSQTASKFFARDLEELAVLNLSGELGTADDEPFDMEKVKSAYATLQEEGPAMGLATESAGPRKGMVGGNQPQVVCEIRKCERSERG